LDRRGPITCLVEKKPSWVRKAIEEIMGYLLAGRKIVSGLAEELRP